MHLGASNTVYSPPLGMKCQSSVLSTQVPLRRDVHGFSHIRCHFYGVLLCLIWYFTMVSAQTASLRHEMPILFLSHIKSRSGMELLCLVLCLCLPVLHLYCFSAQIKNIDVIIPKQFFLLQSEACRYFRTFIREYFWHQPVSTTDNITLRNKRKV